MASRLMKLCNKIPYIHIHTNNHANTWMRTHTYSGKRLLMTESAKDKHHYPSAKTGRERKGSAMYRTKILNLETQLWKS